MISKKLIIKIKKINSLINKLDGSKEISNNYSFKSMREHISEIEELFLRKDEHWAAETSDLLIHCLLLLERNGYQKEKIEELFEARFKKFEEKLLNQLKSQRKI